MSKIFNIKYSILGQYEGMDSSPELIQSFNEISQKYGLMPNTINMQMVTNDGVNIRYRPQFINVKQNYNITFLPERVEITFNILEYKHSLILEETSNLAKNIFDDIAAIVTYPNNRLAITIQGLIEGNRESKMINKENYFADEEFVEWSVSNIHRKQFHFSDRMENVNISVINKHNENGVNLAIRGKRHNIVGTIYNIEYNTLPKAGMKSYYLKDFRFFLDAVNDDMLKTIEQTISVYHG